MSAETGNGKQYGLILPKKGTGDIIQRPSIFDEGSDSGGSGHGEGDWIKKSYQREASKSLEKKQTKMQVQKALKLDPTIYQYDEVYDEIKDKVNKPTPKPEEKKQSRYIQSLKRNAERRKLENERRLERQVQKERQEEGEQFKDKETFVTSSYKKKLEEFQKLDKEEKRMDRLEEICDVSKQGDLSGFYRHLYKTTVDVEQSQEKKNQDIKELLENKTEDAKTSPSKDLIMGQQIKLLNTHKKKERQYRKRTKSGSSREEGEKTTSSSSSSSSTSSSESDGEKRSKLKKKGKENKNQCRDNTPDKSKLSRLQEKENVESSKAFEDKEGKTNNDQIKGGTKDRHMINGKSFGKETNLSVNIWLKRTVGSQFDDALRRYLERKSKRIGSY